MEKNKSLSISLEERKRRIRSTFTRFARMTEWDRDDSRFIELALHGRMDKFWEGALEAVIISPKETGIVAVYPAVDQSLVTELRKKSDPSLIAEFYNRIPRETVGLLETAAEVTRQAVKTMEEQNRVDLHPDGYLDMLNNFVARLLQKGELVEGLDRAQDAVDFAKKKCDLNPNRFRPRLAQAFAHLASAYLFRNQYTESLDAMNSALGIYRDLVATSPKDYSRSLAICLNNRVSVLSKIGRMKEAADSAGEAVRRFREIANQINNDERSEFGGGLEPWTKDVSPDLAACLLAQSTVLSNLGLKQESLIAAQEATDEFEKLDSNYPDQFRPLLAQAYNNLSMGLSRLGRNEEAIAEIDKAVTIFSQLVKVRPTIYRHFLAHVLLSKSAALICLEKWESAIEVCRNAVKHYDQLSNERPDVFLESLVSALEREIMLLRQLGREDEANQTFLKTRELRTRMEKE